MDYLRHFISQVRTRLFLVLVFDNLIFLLDWYLVEHVFHLDGYQLIAALVIVPALTLTLLPWLSTRYLTQPTKLISEAILHLTPEAAEKVPSPDPASAHFGKELVANLIHEVYELATIADRVKEQAANNNDLNAGYIANSLPLPLIILDDKQTIIFANKAAAEYLGRAASDIIGKDMYSVLDLLFTTDETLDK